MCATTSTQANNLQNSNGLYEALTDESKLFLSKDKNIF
jgi:hypothetical protein